MVSQIEEVRTPGQLRCIRELFREYAESRDVDLSAVGFQQELDSLPGLYASPSGRLLVALVDHEPAGCVALRPLGDGVCEMKRLYVRPQFRKHGLGRMLIDDFIRNARLLGYESIRLDTFPDRMPAAVNLYRSYGFKTIPPYWDNPFPGVEYMELTLP